MIIEPNSPRPSTPVNPTLQSPSPRGEPFPLPRPKAPPAPRPSPTENLDRLFLYRRGQLSWDQVAGFRGGARRQGHQLILWSFMAMLIDSLILLSMSCFFLVAFAFIVHSPFGEVFRTFLKMGTLKVFVSVFLASAWMYLLTMRVFFGFSIGEWACDLRLGQPTERMKAFYPLRVFIRSTLIVGTGLLPLPLLSLLTGVDLSGKLSGVKLMSLR